MKFRMNDRVVAKITKSQRLNYGGIVFSSVFEESMGLIDVVFDDDRKTGTVSTVLASNFEKEEN